MSGKTGQKPTELEEQYKLSVIYHPESEEIIVTPESRMTYNEILLLLSAAARVVSAQQQDALDNYKGRVVH